MLQHGLNIIVSVFGVLKPNIKSGLSLLNFLYYSHTTQLKLVAKKSLLEAS
jgi:hypothetical protein